MRLRALSCQGSEATWNKEHTLGLREASTSTCLSLGRRLKASREGVTFILAHPCSRFGSNTHALAVHGGFTQLGMWAACVQEGALPQPEHHPVNTTPVPHLTCCLVLMGPLPPGT